MDTSSARRSAKYRSKLKGMATKWEEHKEKERLRMQKFRNAQKLEADPEKLNAIKHQRKLRMRKLRDKKRLEAAKVSPSKTSPLGSYSCSSTLRKAIKKTSKALPNSPSKRKAVVRQLAMDLLPSEMKPRPKENRPSSSLPEETVTAIQNFYTSDKISWQAPGKRDVKSCVINGKRVKLQKRFMYMTIPEAYELFKNTADHQVSLSKFYDLRPPFVLHVSKTPHNVCVCVIHANFHFLLSVLKKYNPDLKSSAILFCDEKCFDNNCDKCTLDVKKVLDPKISDYSEKVIWKKWINSDLQAQSTTLEELVQETNRTLPIYKEHAYIRNQQLKYFEERKINVKVDEAIMQVDFAENYSLTAQDEIQSAHWTHSQVTLFTCCLWLHGGVIKSYIVVSDDLSHSKAAAWLFIKAIVSHVKHELKIKNLYIFSDNCAGQFKSRYTAFNMLFLANDLGVKTVEWNFFAAGHGKGAIDAIGGQAKRTVWEAVKSRQYCARNPLEFFNCLEKLTKKTNVIFVSEQDIKETSVFLNERWEKCLGCPGIRKLHSFIKLSNVAIKGSVVATSKKRTINILKVSEDNSNRDSSSDLSDNDLAQSSGPKLAYNDVYSDSEADENNEQTEFLKRGQKFNQHKKGQFVLVKFNQFKYVCIIQNVDNEEGEATVMAMKSQKKGFVTDESDISDVKIDQILEVLPQPDLQLTGERVYYIFKQNINVLEQ